MKHYEPSGSARLTTFAFFGLALVAAVPIALAYQLLVEYVPYVQLNVLVACAFGGALGLLGRIAIERGHCRSRALGYGLVVALALVGIALSWAVAYAHLVWRVAQNTNASFAEAFVGASFALYVKVRMSIGWGITEHSSSSPDKFTGWWVIAVWAGEACLAVTTALTVAKKAVQRAYCERCATWCDSRTFRIPGVTRAQVESRLDDLSSVVDAGAIVSDGASGLALEGELCRGCPTAYLSISEVETKVVRGRTHVKKRVVARQLVLDDKARAAFEARLRG